MVTPNPRPYPLYRPEDEHDGCGVGFLADINGQERADILPRALAALCSLKHRGAVDADARSGDGTGLLFALPRSFFAGILADQTGHTATGPVGVGVFFWPRNAPRAQQRGRELMAQILDRRQIGPHCWRTVPTCPNVLGVSAAKSRPTMEHLVIGLDDDLSPGDADRLLYRVRREFEARIKARGLDAYVASMSARTIVYKGLMMADALADYFPDLRRDWTTNFAVFHQRFSTNTLPSWPLAQPFRRLGHNGEINTIVGNANNTQMREADLGDRLWGDDLDFIRSVLERGASDSALLDNVVELLELSGRPMTHVMPMLIPEAWERDRSLSDEVRAFFAYHAGINEPWDGPAAVIYADGDVVGAHLDRNGLRPLRFQQTQDGLLCAGSEVGILDISSDRIVARGRLGPGHMLAVDLRAGKVLTGDRIKAKLAAENPYGQWLEEALIHLDRAPFRADNVDENKYGDAENGARSDETELLRRQLTFGYSGEELRFIFEPMTESGDQPISSMGDDTPISVLSQMPRLLPTYFKQRFAQVTNPPIDPIRETSVMSLSMHLGRRHDWLARGGRRHADKIAIDGPILSDADLDKLLQLAGEDRLTRLECVYAPASGASAMVDRLDALCEAAEAAVDDGGDLLLLSDRGLDKDHAPVPMLLALGAVSTHLLRAGKRLRTSLIIESGEPRDVHHFATLIGYGASAVVPYLAIDTIVDQSADGTEAARHVTNFIKSVEQGLLKVMSKMGISVLGSYRDAQIFEALGLGEEVIERCFPHTPSPIGGLGFAELANEASRRHLRAWGPESPARLEDLGYFRFRRNGETHAWGPGLLRAMNKFRRSDDKTDAYDAFARASRGDQPLHLRDLVDFESADAPIAIDKVESVEAIRRRFTTAAMSLGALSPEAHEALAIAMNRIQGKSNSGEGGEDRARYELLPNGDDRESAIKQVASGRFGVTPEYLARAKELEIKMAQGSKPGEGGQLPGHKVSDYIAGLRHATPGTPLISPPPHHDIYSIEDLAQLIYDLKSINDGAHICVKLVAESGVGTIAAGVAKAHADVILISGHDGGTGASPLSSIKNAGNAWEIGLAETQQVLRRNGLRERVKLRVDGGFKTGRDVVVGALLGAEEFNFGTAALIALGCRYVRQCHLDTCPVGIATQREDLRKKYTGDPDNVVAYFDAVAQEVRQILARLGVRKLQEIIGRSEYLKHKAFADHRKASTLDLSALIAASDGEDAPFCTWPQNLGPGKDNLNHRLLADAEAALATGERFEGRYIITNGDRTVGATLAGRLAVDHADIDDDFLRLRFEGTAGQSFGAFAAQGMTLCLDGEANDYVAKGLGGGRVVVAHPMVESTDRDILVGNTVLYGATGGECFVAGRAGERFAVRNSGARAVVEGIGDHGCEYMTAGTVLILGSTGKNFGAGMTGGIAYIYDPESRLDSRHHDDFIVLQSVDPGSAAAKEIRELLQAHLRWTGSARAQAMLDKFDDEREHFRQAIPKTLLDVEERAAE